MDYASSSEPIYVNDPYRSTLGARGGDDGTTRVGRYRAAAWRKAANDDPSAGYGEQVKQANAMTEAASAHGLPDAQEVNPTQGADDYLSGISKSAASPPMGAKAAAFAGRSAPKIIDLNVDSAGERLPMRFGAQGAEGMATMQEFEPDAYAAVQRMSQAPKANMHATVNGQQFVGTPRAGVSEAGIQRTRAEYYRKKVEQDRLKNTADTRAHELALAKAPGEQRLAEKRLDADLKMKDPSAAADIDLKRAQVENLKQQWAKDMEDRKARLNPQQQAAVDQRMALAKSLAEQGNQKGAASAIAEAARLSGMPMDPGLLAELAKPTAASRGAEQDVMAPVLNELDQDVGQFIGWYDKYGLPGSGSDRALAQRVAESAYQKLLSAGADPTEAKHQVDRIMLKHNLTK